MKTPITIQNKAKLTLIKVIHTLIWVFFNFVIFYMLYAVIANKLDLWLWFGYGFVFLEGLTLLTFKTTAHSICLRGNTQTPQRPILIFIFQAG